MGEREELIRNLRQLIELERASGVEFVAKGPAGTPAPAPASQLRPSQPRPIQPLSSSSPVFAPTPPVTAVAPSEPSMPRKAAIPPTAPPLSLATTGLPSADLATIATAIAACQRCKLCTTRNQTVPGEGNLSPELMFVGEGPGADEDEQGRPFVGMAGQLLTKMIEAMGLKREEVFIANIVKCRPPGNRVPEPDEIAACMPYLERQILALKPKIICSLGNTPLRALMGDDKMGITKVRGQHLNWRGFTLIPTFHPSYLLRNPPAKKPCWEDLQVVLKALGRELPKK